jgi:site-specific DNA recombinase
MRVVGYTRVSTEDQARDGVSMDAQAEKVRLFAELHNLELVEVIADAGVSAKTIDRPGLSRALAMLDSGEAGGVVVYKLDRLTRDLGDWTDLIDRYFGEKGGRSLMSVSESIDTRTAGGRMVLNIMMTIAMWEREVIAERTRHALAYKRSRGERIGRCIPYGRALAPDGRTLVVDPTELDLAREAADLQASGWSMRRIAAEFQGRGVPTKAGGGWTFSAVRSLLKRRPDASIGNVAI